MRVHGAATIAEHGQVERLAPATTVRAVMRKVEMEIELLEQSKELELDNETRTELVIVADGFLVPAAA